MSLLHWSEASHQGFYDELPIYSLYQNLVPNLPAQHLHHVEWNDYASEFLDLNDLSGKFIHLVS